MVVVGLALLALFIAAAASVLGSDRLTGTGKLLWIVGIFVFPFLGPLAWFFVGRKGSPQIYRPVHYGPAA
ncbi:hypothetical protein GIS00_13885 [Nakamurella sp. YIM 132087]|uniref:Cardiolipin synthase N-terminal domain-containing protein n=2 Tax=Nakamurella alba TaxID=2665158 RepID=A0A7K1FLU0_9ACTN|nr:hypothetical protein [Nakamurella alba]